MSIYITEIKDIFLSQEIELWSHRKIQIIDRILG